MALLSHHTTSALQEILPDELLDTQEKSKICKNQKLLIPLCSGV